MCSITIQAQVSPIERAALQAIYTALDGPNWKSENDADPTNDWDFSGPVKTGWEGLSIRGGHVFQLKLIDNDQTGSIPPQIGDFPALETIEIKGGPITGGIPPEIGNLSTLTGLFLRDNELTGSIPDVIGNLNALRTLSITENNLSGQLPSTLGNLSNLVFLSITGNRNLIGAIPSQLGNLNQLQTLQLIGNSLSGAIPSQLGNLNQLQSLRLSSNQLTGTIPAEIGNLSQLTTLSLSANDLEGEIPTAVSNLIALRELHVANNNLEGTIPKSLGNLINLENLYLYNNEFIGVIPDEFLQLQKLTNFLVRQNQLSGRIPDFTAIRGLKALEIHHNAFHFGDFENEFNAYEASIFDFKYNSQALVNLTENPTVIEGGSITFRTTVRGNQNRYQWYKDNQPIAGATNASLTLTNVKATDAGVYDARITNTTVTGLTLQRNPITLKVTLAPKPPACTTLMSPVDNATGVSVSTSLSWSPLSTASGYRIRLGTTAGGEEIVKERDNFASTTYTPVADLPENTKIYTTIIPYNDVGDAGPCTSQAFTTQRIVPQCTTPVSPRPNEKKVSVKSTISWEAVASAKGYRIQIGTTDGGMEVLGPTAVEGTTRFTPVQSLPDDTTLFVRIIPYDKDNDDATGCATYSFTTEDVLYPPQCTTIVNPVNGATAVSLTTAMLTWETVPDATGYRISTGIVTDKGKESLLSDHDVGNATSFNPFTLIPLDIEALQVLYENTTFYVEVVPYNADGKAEHCASIQFTTENIVILPECTTILSPTDTATEVSSGNIEISWEEVFNASGYILQIGTRPESDDVLDLDMELATSYTNDLPQGTPLYVTVIPYNEDGLAEGCTGIQFTTASEMEEDGISSSRVASKYGFSPDGDGINDVWEIDGIENSPDNEVLIYNRWNEAVFRMRGYDNRTRVFEGIANTKTGFGAGQLPEGTYFFEIKVSGTHTLENLRGFLVLKR